MSLKIFFKYSWMGVALGFLFLATRLSAQDDFSGSSALQKKEVSLKKLDPWNGKLRYQGFDWQKISENVRKDPKMKAVYEKVLAEAKKVASKGVVLRPENFSQVPTNDYAPGWERRGKNAETFILAKISDFQCYWLSRELVTAAVAARVSGDPALLDFVKKQLEEITANWHPFQLPGWTLATDKSTLGKEGDGVWLATGWGLVGMVTILDVLGEKLPASLIERARELIKKEVALVLTSWEKQIPWYVKKQAYESNQWAFPLVGLLLGSMWLGEDYQKAYELAALGLAKTCLSQGEDGSWVEGLSYSMITANLLLQGILAMKRIGDDRLTHYSFVKNYGSWCGQMHLPGGALINAFDSGFVKITASANPVLLWSALASGQSGPAWVVEGLYDELPDSWVTWIFDDANKAKGGASRQKNILEPLPKYATFPDSAMVVWRSGWDPAKDWAVWMRGGSPNDFHAHRDQGHLSIQDGTNAVLVEMGTAGYGAYHQIRANATGHNVLQTAGARPLSDQGVVAPIELRKMDATGGELSISAAGAYTDVSGFRRRIVWGPERRVEVEDLVRMKSVRKGDEEWFRWITGTGESILMTQKEAGVWTATWSAAEITIRADRAIRLEPAEYPALVLDQRPGKIIVVKVVDRVDRIRITTEIHLKKN